MKENKKDDSHSEIDLEEEHKAIATYLRRRFRQFIESQSKDFDPKGNRRPFFKERDKFF